MKIVFVSNYFNHHQKALSDAFFNYTNGNYFFIQTSPMSEERIKLGYKEECLPNYVLVSYDDCTKERCN